MRNDNRFERCSAATVSNASRRKSGARCFSAIFTVKKYTRVCAMCASPLLYAVIVFASVAYAQQDTFPLRQDGTARSTFMRSSADSCVETQTAAPANKFIPRDRIVRFCNCYAKVMADTVTAQKIDAMAKEQTSDTLQKKAQTATTQCLKQ
jgi:hypothetical protein